MKASDNVFPKLLLAEGAAPATPAAGSVIAYAKADGLLYSKDDAGTETPLGGGGGSGDVSGPASSVDSHVALFDGPTGKLLKDGGALGDMAGIDDAPSDGTGYVRKDGAWAPESGGSGTAPVVTESGTSLAATGSNAGNYTRFTSASAKAYTFSDAETYTTDDEYHGRNVGAGDLTLTAGGAFTLNAPAGGTLVIPQGGTFTVKIVGATEADVFGVTVAV